MKNKLKFTKFVRTQLPLIYFICAAIALFYGENYNYVTLGIILILIIQLIIKNKIVGISLGILISIISFVMFLAVISEFNDFEAVSTNALQLITIGSLLTLSGLSMGIIMIKTSIES